MTRRRMYIEAMSEILSGADKVVIDQGSVGSSGVVPLMSLNELLRSSAAPAGQQGGVK